MLASAQIPYDVEIVPNSKENQLYVFEICFASQNKANLFEADIFSFMISHTQFTFSWKHLLTM